MKPMGPMLAVVSTVIPQRYFTLKEKQGLCVFKNAVLRKIFGSVKEEMTGMKKFSTWGWKFILI
jgi:hypothetical protein